MDTQRWNWRMRGGSSPGDAITPSSSQIWVGADAIPPTSTYTSLLTGAVLTHPSLAVSEIRVRLFQEIAIRRDGSRRRARSSPSQTALSCQWVGTLALGTAVHKGGVVADATVIDIKAVPSITAGPSGVRQWLFAAPLSEHQPRTWTWTACEGERKKIWFLDMRYRIIAEAFHDCRLVAAARSFVTFCPTPTVRPPRLDQHRQLCLPSANPALPAAAPVEFVEDIHVPLSRSDRSAGEPGDEPVSGSSSEENRLRQPQSAFRNWRRTAMAFTRPPQAEDTAKRSRCPENKASTGPKRSISLLGTCSDITQNGSADSSTSLSHLPFQRVSKCSEKTVPSHEALTSTEEFDDMTITTLLHASCQPPTSDIRAQFKLTELVAATINLVPKVSVSQLKITAVLTEVIEIVDDRGTRQVHLQHHHRMRVSPTPSAASRRHEISCVAQMTATDKLFSADASFDFMRISHRLDVSVKYERRRLLGGLLFAEIAPTEHDLWGIVDATGMKVVSSTLLGLGHGEKSEQQTTVPWLAVWGSTDRIATVGISESRVPRRKPAWATSNASEPQPQEVESEIDTLRRLAYANAGPRRRENSPNRHVDEDDRRFPTFQVDEGGALTKQNCPVCLELLDGEVTMLPCLHASHRSCFVRSQNIASVCPVCRLDLSPYVESERIRAELNTVAHE